MNATSQDDIFQSEESDAWFLRNKAALEQWDPASDLPLRLLSLYDLKPNRVLEIGASCGFRTAYIADRYGVEACAVEPSREAIAYGIQHFPRVKFFQGMASSIPVQGVFDLVIVNFVLHWIDRSTLLSSVKEIDRLVAEGGLLLLGDFFTSNSWRVQYHHRATEDVFTYKQDYAGLFRHTGLYYQVAHLTTGHADKALSAFVDEQERIHASLLRKESQQGYVPQLKTNK